MCDWVLLETNYPHWDAEQVASIHPAAFEPDWSPPADAEFMVVGFSGIFREEDQGEMGAFISGILSGVDPS